MTWDLYNWYQVLTTLTNNTPHNKNMDSCGGSWFWNNFMGVI